MTEPGLEQVKLTGAQETTLATLYGKAMESRKADSILRDDHAYAALQRIDYDFTKLRVRLTDYLSLAVRAKAYDTWARQYLDENPDCTVLHLGCGLDTRVYRLNPPPTVRWYDVDLPDVIELRRRLFPPRDGTYLIPASVTDPHLLDGIPGDTPVLVVAEGLTPYLRAVDGMAMLRRITEHFPAGELLFDGYGRWGVWLLQRYGCVKASGAQLDWYIDDPRELERAVPGLRLEAELWYPDAPGMEQHYSPLYRDLLRAVYRIRPLRRLGRPLRYRFGML
jgi:O-methyltransferase involved in polyketide biosynthesis